MPAVQDERARGDFVHHGPVHKLAHFHDAVHGTRHSFYMEEMRYEFNEDWIEMMESKGFDIASMEASGKWDRQLWGTQF